MLPIIPLLLPGWLTGLVSLLIAAGLWAALRRWRPATGLGPLLTAIPLAWLIAWLSGDQAGQLDLPTWSVITGLGIIGCYLWAEGRSTAAGIEARQLLVILGVGLLAGAIGARAWYLIEFAGRLPAGTPLFEWTGGGMVLYGGMIVGTAAVLLTARLQQVPLNELAAALTPPTLVAIACGRIGCHFNGCCFGSPTDLPWGISPVSWQYLDGQWHQVDHYGVSHQYLHASAWTTTTRIHPTQLYETVACGILAVACWLLPLTPSRRWLLGLGGYAVWRFANELLRADNPPDPILGAGLSRSQFVSIALLALVVIAWFRVPATPISETDDDRTG